VWNMNPEEAVQRKTLSDLMSVRLQPLIPFVSTLLLICFTPIILQVLDISASTDCIHYLAFGDLLPGDMRQRIAARTMHASVQRLQFHDKGTGQQQCAQPSHIEACCAPAPMPEAVGPEPPAILDVCLHQRQHLMPTDQRILSDRRDVVAAQNIAAVSEPLISIAPACIPSCSGVHERLSAGSGVAQVHLIFLPLLAAALWWLWSFCSQ